MHSNFTDSTLITKASGQKVPFHNQKLRDSLERAGASDLSIDMILREVKNSLYDGISSKVIYKKAFALLRKMSKPAAARYSLKKSIQDLGPSGYPFEKYVSEILKYQGYETQVGVLVQGHCVQHEVDVVASKNNKQLMVECKFHSDDGRKCDVKVPLYIHSRFLDVEKAWRAIPGNEFKTFQGWVVTNTRFSEDAVQYGLCAGLHLVGWDFPKQGSLKERIDLSGLHPVTCLTTLTKKEKQKLLDKMIVLCKEICYDEKALHGIGLNPARLKKVMLEAGQLCTL